MNYKLWILLGAGYFLFRKGSNGTDSNKPLNSGPQLDQLVLWVKNHTNMGYEEKRKLIYTFYHKMTQKELEAVHLYIFEYFNKNKALSTSNPLYSQIRAVSSKYQIFN